MNAHKKSYQKPPAGFVDLVLGGAILLTVALGMIYLILSNRNAQMRTNRAEIAHDIASRKLESLLNLAYNDPSLDGAEHSEGLTRWKAEIVGPRLKKITVAAHLANSTERALASKGETVVKSESGLQMIGYKYDDF